MSRRLFPLALCAASLCAAVLACPPVLAQPAATLDARSPADDLSIEQLFGSYEFYGAYFRGGKWAAEGPVLTFVERDRESGATHLVELDLRTDERTRLIDGRDLARADGQLVQLEEYQFSADGRYALLFADSERVWRYNTKGVYYLFDTEQKTVQPIADPEAGLQMFAKFDPAGRRVAFVRERDLYVVDAETMAETRLTSTGSPGGVINGTFDWVYEEEFGLRDGFQWSPDGRHLAFYQLDESATKEFTMYGTQTLYPELTSFRYPKAGEVNSEIRIGVIEMDEGYATRFFDTDTWFENPDAATEEVPEYLASMGWTPLIDGQHHVWTIRLDRDQNDLDLLYLDPAAMTVERILEEDTDTYHEVETGFSDVEMGTVTFLEDDEHFIFRSDRDGYAHLYLYQNDGTLVQQVTRGQYDVTDFHGLDEAAGVAYVTTTAESPMQRHLYAVDLDGDGSPRKITSQAGWHSVNVSSDRQYYIDAYSNATTPTAWTLHRTADGEQIAVLEDNARLKATIAALGLRGPEFFEVPAADSPSRPGGSTMLNAYILKPTDFDERRAYPLLVHTYAGPGSQEVVDRWGGTERLWHQWLAEEYGVLVAGVDNRGTGGRGRDFKEQTYRRLGPMEAEDQTAFAQHLGRQDWVDAERIGIWGWSYGGYVTLLAMLSGDGPDTFHLGISGAPVTNWRFYDTIYTERYLSTPQKNAAGYDEGAPLSFADRLQDDQHLLLIHGDADDNVHVQNTVAMAAALQDAGKQFDLMIYPGLTHSAIAQRAVHVRTLMTDYILDGFGIREGMAAAE